MHLVQAINKAYEDDGLYRGTDKEGNYYSVTFNDSNEMLICKNGMQFRISLDDIKFECFYKQSNIYKLF
jgi:hypothetical protein